MISLEERKARIRAQRRAEGEETRDRAEDIRARFDVQAEDSMSEFAARIAREHGSLQPSGIMVGGVRSRADLEELAGKLEKAQATSSRPATTSTRLTAAEEQVLQDCMALAKFPEVAARIAAAPEAARPAMRRVFLQGLAEAKALARLDMPQLWAEVEKGDAGALAILRVREKCIADGEFHSLWPSDALAQAARWGFSEADLRKEFDRERAGNAGQR